MYILCTIKYLILVVIFFMMFGVFGIYAASDTFNISVDITAAPGGDEGGGTTTPIPTISNLAVLVDSNIATITWTTIVPSYANVYWGETTNYEVGSMLGDVLQINHSVLIEDLEPNTQYHYKINVTSEFWITSTTGDKTFITEPLDITAPANVSKLEIILSDDDEVELSWVNPPDIDFDSVRIMRSSVFYPNDPVDGMVVYEGDYTETVDIDVVAGTKYYYTVFAKDVSGNYSSGAISSIEIPVPLAEPVDEPDEPDDDPTKDTDDVGPTDDGDGGGIGGTDDGDSEDKDISELDEVDGGEGEQEEDTNSLSDVVSQTFEGSYIQDGEEQTFQNNQEISISTGRSFIILVPIDQVPENTGSIIFTITDSQGIKNEYLLKLNQNKTAYEAVIPALVKSGKYDVDIVIYNFAHQPIKMLSSVLNAYEKIAREEFFNTTIQRAVTYTGVGVGILGVGIGQAIVATTQITSILDLWLIILRFFSSLFGFFRKHKKEQWGVVYDSVTKRPLDPAYLKIQREGRDYKTAISDIDGRYGFLVPHGSYTLNVHKTHYKFPSEKLAGRTEDELYDNLYFGGPIEINANTSELIQKNIPLDPIGFDWNEYIKQQKNLFVLHSRKKQVLLIVAKLVFFVGFAFSAYALWLDPSLMFNYYIFILYVFIFLIQLIHRTHSKVTQLVDKNTDLPIPFAIIKAYLIDKDRLIKKVVSDEFGNFYLMTSPGTYYFTIEKKLADGSYSQPYRTKPISLKKGVVLKNLYLL